MMDSALCLHRGALHIPSTTSQAAGLAMPYSSFRPSSLSLFSKASTYRTLSRHTFSSPVICALNKPSSPSPNYDKDNGKKIVIVVGGASVVLACVLGVINYNFNFSPTAIASQDYRSRGSSSTHGGGPVGPLSRPEEVLDSLLMVNRHLAKPKIKWTRKLKPIPKLSIPERPEPQDWKQFKIAVADLIKSGMCDEAERQLINLYNETSKKKGPLQAKDVEMELVLVLIFQEKYNDALARDCLSGDPMGDSDGRVHFYKAIINTMLITQYPKEAEEYRKEAEEYRKEAEKCWSLFVKSYQSQPPSEAPEVPHPKSPRNLH